MNFADIATSTNGAITTTIGNVFQLVGDNIVVILSVLSVSIGIPFIVKMVRRFAK